ncbi:MAG: PD40 domain-containing protein [Ignavibacteria bacterium]|nr:PD40 domain-containing protein [Ignavibacteria bacterium]
MIRKYFCHACVVILMSMCLEQNAIAQPQPYTSLNSRQDDYAVAFRTVQNRTELWVTTSRGKDSASKRSRKIMMAPVTASGVGEFTALPFPINQSQSGKSSGIELDGCPIFSQCDGSYGIMVSNRLLPNNKSAGNDLYEIIASASGEWSIKRLDDVNSEFWDDTPALSPDGKFLYFASDRRSPGKRKTDVFVSSRTGSGWSVPVALDIINTSEFSEQTPFVSGDGYLYYATNKSGDYDIWRTRIDRSTGMPVGGASILDMPDVNKPGSDEGQPFYSPSGEWFLFTSNRSGTKINKDFDVFSIHIPQQDDTLQITVLLRTQKVLQNGEFEDITEPQATRVFAKDNSGNQMIQASNNKGLAQFIIPRVATNEPAFDRRVRSIVVRAHEKNPDKQISSVDTLLYDGFCRLPLTHTLIIWDTATYFTTGCRQDFPIVNVQFFVSAYWCPTTLQFQKYTPCGSILQRPDCKVSEIAKPTLQCESNDVYSYKLRYVEPTVEVSRQYGLCADLNEAKQHGEEYAMKVDSAVSKFVENMEIALRQPCVLRAIRAKKPVTIEVVGWTDPRSIDGRCIYTGRDINLMTSFVKIQESEQKPYISGGILRSGTAFSKSGAGGNQMLSDLRAYYTAAMLDTLWQERIPEYKSLRKQSGALSLIAIGKAVSLERNATYGQQRSVNVRIIAEDDNEVKGSKKIPLPSSSVVVCGEDCIRTQAYNSEEKIPTTKVENRISTPITQPIETRANISDRATNCYSILFHTFTSEADAIKLQKEIQSQKFNYVRILTSPSGNGGKNYRVLSDCYDTNDSAELVKRELAPMFQALSVKCKPMIVQE